MFNLEEQISKWRRQMLAAGIKSPAPLEELESHLRDNVEQQVRSGLCEQAAFETTVREFGRAEVLKTEFARVRETAFERLIKSLCRLAGFPNYQLITDMNTNANPSNLEARWATYVKAVAFIFPAAFLWLFTVVFVLPKVNQLCQAAGTRVFDFTNAPAIFRGSGVIGQAMIFLTSHGLLIGGTVILAFVLLERYFRQWPRYRRQAIGLGVFLLNAVVLLSLALMIVSMVVAAPNVTHQGH
jgi:hypothetical protein